jgi:hypothetical protein
MNGIPASAPDWAARVMGALVLADPLEAPARAAGNRLEAARAAAEDLGLGGFKPYLDHLDGALERVRGMYRPGGGRPPGGGTPQARPALETAGAYLVSDLSFQESWEIHRYGLFGRDEVVSRFPAGLVLEILCGAGYDLGETVDAFLARSAAFRFGYFDDPDFVLRDADTLGLGLRLWGCGSRMDTAVLEALESGLAAMEGSVREDGRIPVWLEDAPAGVRLAGEGCGVVEAHLLLGLLAFDPVRFEGIIMRSVAGLFDRFAALGSGISVNYPGLYALTVVRRLAAALDSAGIAVPGSADRLEAYRPALVLELEWDVFSPQAAAFAIEACTGPDAVDLYRDEWPVMIRKHQRSDGSWNAEPFCFVANRGNRASWYSSRTLTTAFCYRALRMISKNKD